MSVIEINPAFPSTAGVARMLIARYAMYANQTAHVSHAGRRTAHFREGSADSGPSAVAESGRHANSTYAPKARIEMENVAKARLAMASGARSSSGGITTP